MYDLSDVQNDYDEDDFELEDNFSEVEVATVDDNMLDQVKQVYNDILHQSTAPFL